MVELFPMLTLWGETFSPRRAEEETGLPLARKTEPGEIGVRGKFRGKPMPHGAAHLTPPDTVGLDDRIAWLCEAAARHLATYRRLGVTVCKFHLGVDYWDQCNLCFNPEELARIASLGVNFTITCIGRSKSWSPPVA